MQRPIIKVTQARENTNQTGRKRYPTGLFTRAGVDSAVRSLRRTAPARANAALLSEGKPGLERLREAQLATRPVSSPGVSGFPCSKRGAEIHAGDRLNRSAHGKANGFIPCSQPMICRPVTTRRPHPVRSDGQCFSDRQRASSACRSDHWRSPAAGLADCRSARQDRQGRHGIPGAGIITRARSRACTSEEGDLIVAHQKQRFTNTEQVDE